MSSQIPFSVVCQILCLLHQAHNSFKYFTYLQYYRRPAGLNYNNYYHSLPRAGHEGLKRSSRNAWGLSLVSTMSMSLSALWLMLFIWYSSLICWPLITPAATMQSMTPDKAILLTTSGFFCCNWSLTAAMDMDSNNLKPGEHFPYANIIYSDGPVSSVRNPRHNEQNYGNFFAVGIQKMLTCIIDKPRMLFCWVPQQYRHTWIYKYGTLANANK